MKQRDNLLKYKVLWSTCPLCKTNLLSILNYEGGVLITCENTKCKGKTLLQAAGTISEGDLNGH